MIGGGINPFSGSIANIQAYNSVLSNYQAAKLYYEGLEGIAISPKNLIDWWPLNGNTNDINGVADNGNVIGTSSYQYIYGYSGDPIYDGSFYNPNQTNLIEGVDNCPNISQCSNFSIQHLYLGQASLSSLSGVSKSEASSLGFANAVVPNVGSFNGNGFVFGNLISYYNGGSGLYTFSTWIYVDANTNGAALNICEGALGTCSSATVISVSQNTISTLNGGSLSYAITTPNTWHQVTVVYNSGTKSLYVDGSLKGSTTGALSITGSGSLYWSNKGFNGKMGDVQFFESGFAAAQAGQLYLNDTVNSISPTDIWPLSTVYNGLSNQTINTANAINPGYFANNNGVCSNANVIDYICGAQFSQP